MKNKKLYVVCGVLVFLMVATKLFCDYFFKEKKFPVAALRQNLNKVFDGTYHQWPKSFSSKKTEYNIQYTFNEDLSFYIEKLLKKKSADYSTVIVIDNNNGNILSAVGYKRKGKEMLLNLPFTSTHPSASLIKIITAAELIENGRIDKNTIFSYNGKGTTLYKYQFKDRITKWTRYTTFKSAFAYSNNVVFGKAAINNISSYSIFKMAREFGFNKNLFKELDMTKSVFHMPQNQYNLAEFASGLNRKTLISPIHGAVLSSIIANDGILKYPRIVEKVVSSLKKNDLWTNELRKEQVITRETSQKLKHLMRLTVIKGTAKKIQRRMKKWIRNIIDIGAKTGSITGGLPFGKRDWLTAYAMPKTNKKDKGISICVMNINLDRWYVKSTYLAKNIIEYYYSKIEVIKTAKN